MTLVLTLQLWVLVPALWLVAGLWFLVDMVGIDAEGLKGVAVMWLATGGSAILARLLP